MTTEQWEHENQDTLMEYFIDGDPSVRRIQCEHCRKVIYTQTRNRKYCSFQTCGHKMLNLRKSIRKRIERGTYTCPCCGEQFLPIRADIAAMPVGRKTTASAKRRDTLATDNFCHLPDFMLLFEELDKDCQVPHPRLLL